MVKANFKLPERVANSHLKLKIGKGLLLDDGIKSYRKAFSFDVKTENACISYFRFYICVIKCYYIWYID
ncbi:hypothetical protein CW304_25360 [Bacillus sp. UFRGS-B20]|nr:hypothetical protein CW304_25360 [Bacillus sp. UFRGS-B20]